MKPSQAIMKTKLLIYLALVLGGLAGCSTASFDSGKLAGNDTDKHLAKQIQDVLTECQKIKPGMTRAELLKVFTTEGGLSTARHRTFVYRGCPYIKVDVDFILSNPKRNMVEEQPTDIISKISKPYLEWSVAD